MLAFDPSNRITIQQALDHPFFDELKTKAYFSGFANKAAAAQNNTSPTGMEQIDDSPEHFFRNVSRLIAPILEFIFIGLFYGNRLWMNYCSTARLISFIIRI